MNEICGEMRKEVGNDDDERGRRGEIRIKKKSSRGGRVGRGKGL